MFLGHTSELKFGESKPLAIFDNKKILTNDNGKYKLGSNICPHQTSRILSNTSTEIKCQYHGWSWNLDGSPKDSGTSKTCNNVKLFFKNVFEYNGLLFEKEINTAILDGVDFTNLKLDEFRVEELNADPKIVMDIFLDVDHIPIVHRGVYDLLGIEGDADVTWSYADWGNIQTVKDQTGKIIARWVAVYPYTMIEWQSEFLFITQCIGNKKIAVWKYKNLSYTDLNYETNAQMWEKAFAQDKIQAEQMVQFPTINLEEAKLHYRNWIKQNNYD